MTNKEAMEYTLKQMAKELMRALEDPEKPIREALAAKAERDNYQTWEEFCAQYDVSTEVSVPPVPPVPPLSSYNPITSLKDGLEQAQEERIKGYFAHMKKYVLEYFSCDCCGRVFPKNGNEQEVLDEYKENFPDYPIENTETIRVCDDCYNHGKKEGFI